MTEKSTSLPTTVAPAVVPNMAPANKPKMTKKNMILVGGLLFLAVLFYMSNSKIAALQRRNKEIVQQLQQMNPKYQKRDQLSS